MLYPVLHRLERFGVVFSDSDQTRAEARTDGIVVFSLAVAPAVLVKMPLTNYVSVYVVWAAIVVIVFPPVFRFL
jgi:hypothetical protein